MNLSILNKGRDFRFNKLWARVSKTWIAPYVCHKAQALSALTIFNMFKENPFSGGLMAGALFGRPLRGAGIGWESRTPLIPEPDSTSPLDVTGTNSVDFTCRDFFTVLEIGFIWQVAGTSTALIMDFDKFTAPNAAGDVTDKLDGTNGVITSPDVASQAVAGVLTKDLGDTLGIDLDKGNSVRAIVTTTVTGGSGIPYVLGIARAETNANLVIPYVSS